MSSKNKEYFDLLEKTVKQFRKFAHREFSKREIEISSEQWLVMERAFDNPGITQKDLAVSTNKDPASVTRMIDLLENRNFIIRKRNKQDRRSYGIYLSPDGEDFVAMVRPLSDEMKSFGLKNISEKDQKVFLDVLNKICENFE